MINPLSSNASQQLIANPYQNTGNQQQSVKNEEQKPQQNQVQPSGAQAAGTQQTQNNNNRSQEVALAPQNDSADNSSNTDQPRGSIVDIEV